MKSDDNRRLPVPRRLARGCVGILLTGLTLDLFARPLAIDIAPQALDKALAELGSQSGLQLLYRADLVTGKKSPGVHGETDPLKALNRLLRDADLDARIEGGTIYLTAHAEPPAPMELGAVTIQGQGMGEMTENSGSYTTDLTSVGSKSPTRLRQVPQSVSVVTQQAFADQHLVDLADAMKSAPGVTVQKGNYRLPAFYSRGFSIENIQIDGAAPMALGTTAGSFYSNKTYELAEFDHIEVLRGASGLFGGTGDPGGIINLVRKRPLDSYQLTFDASAGSWDNYRSQLDVTGPLAFDGKLRGRLVTAYTDKQYFTDISATQKPLIYGVLEADLLPDTRLTLGGRSEQIHENGNGSELPRYSTGEDLGLPRHTNLTSGWAYLDGRSQELFAKVDQALAQDWKLNLSYTRTLDSGFSKASSAFGAVDPNTGQGSLWYGADSRYRSDQVLWDANLSGPFRALGQEHQWLFGIDYQKIASRWRGTQPLDGIDQPVDVFDPAATPWTAPPTDRHYTRDYSPNRQKQYGAYSTLRLQLADPLHLIVGARAQRYEFAQLYRQLDPTSAAWEVQSNIAVREPTRVVPFGGLVYDLDDQWSSYFSYSEIFKPQQDKLRGPLPGKPIDPTTGRTYEVGLKGALLDGRVNTSFALYYTEQDNLAQLDPLYPSTSVLFGGNCCYVTQGEVVSRGVDMEVSGEVLPDLSVSAGYTFNLNRDRTQDAALSSITPRHTLKLWSTYRLPDALNDFKVGGGVNFQSATFVSGTAAVRAADGSVALDSSGSAVTRDYDYKQAGYGIWNMMLEYRLDEHWSLTYNANNVFDKTYYFTVGASDSGNYYGEPRSQMLTLQGRFW
ncbi:TonB-dependent siderophore receptor [Pseudomonas sp. NPDC087358]|uniref:TonB-dependent siderophore receptor n=1 Tax=Pseudomonas sp. NPDC087358 TaxID=3364439 RepID=UPI00384E7001